MPALRLHRRLAAGAVLALRAFGAVRAPRLRGRRRTVGLWASALTAAGLAAVAVTVVLGLQADRRQRERADAARAVPAERVRLTRLHAPHRGAAADLRPEAGAGAAPQRAARAALVRRVEARITRDARARARAGELEGRSARPSAGRSCVLQTPCRTTARSPGRSAATTAWR